MSYQAAAWGAKIFGKRAASEIEGEERGTRLRQAGKRPEGDVAGHITLLVLPRHENRIKIAISNSAFVILRGKSPLN